MNRFERAAARISRDHGVHVEYNASNREYIVECALAGNTARKAEQVARKTAHAANTYGVLGGIRA